MSKLTVNGQMREFDAEPDTPLLWVLREQLDSPAASMAAESGSAERVPC